MRSQKASLEQKVEDLKKKITLRKQQLETDIVELERKPSSQLKQLRKDKMNLDAEYNQIPHRIEMIQKEKATSEERLKKWRDGELEQLQKSQGETKKKSRDLTNKDRR